MLGPKSAFNKLLSQSILMQGLVILFKLFKNLTFRVETHNLEVDLAVVLLIVVLDLFLP